MRSNNKITDIKNRPYIIPPNYNDIFKRRVLIITGVGRSGTTILGKVFGSLNPAYYLFDAAIMRLLPILGVDKKTDKQTFSSLMQSLLFEDYFLQIIHGRKLNFNAQDDSYFNNYMSQKDAEQRWRQFSRRQDVMNYLKKARLLFVIKVPGFQPFCSVAEQIFPEAVFMHIIRNGNDVVLSAKKKGWYTDDFITTAMIDWVEKSKSQPNLNVPWYLDEQSKAHFAKWNQITRAASVWRNLTEQGMAFCQKNSKQCWQFKYEDFVKSPDALVARAEKAFKVRRTKITEAHLSSIKSHRMTQYPSIIKDIQAPEQAHFVSLMKKLNYLTK